MKKKVVIGVLSLLSAACCGLTVAGCTAGNGDGNAKHNFSSTYSKDAEGHYYECLDEGCDAVSDKTPHAWGDPAVTVPPSCENAGEQKVSCSVCGYEKTEEVKANGHSWDKGVVTKEPTAEEKGVKTFSCACGATYNEDIPKLTPAEPEPPSAQNGYKITVLGADDQPFAGAEVEIDGIAVQTRADGSAEFADFERGEYDIEVYAEGYTVVAPVKSGSAKEYTVKLSKECPDGVISASAMGKTRFAAAIGWENDPEIANRIKPKDEVFTLKNTGAQAMKYTIELDNMIAFAAYDNVPKHSVGIFGSMGIGEEHYAPVEIVLEAGESYSFKLTGNTLLATVDWQDKSVYPVCYDVIITGATAPAKGSVKQYMFAAAAEGKTEQTAAPNTPVYFKFDTTSGAYKGADFKFEFDGDNIAIENLGQSITAASGSAIESGKAFAASDYYATVLKVTAKDGHIEFTSTKTFPEGGENSPIRIFEGDTVEGTVGATDRNMRRWYSLENNSNADKTYTIVPDAEKGKKMVFYVYDENGATVAYSIEGQKKWFTVPAGKTCKIAVGNTSNGGGFTFDLRAYDPETDVGGNTFDDPLTYVIEAGTNTFNVSLKAGEPFIAKFITFETAKSGYYTVNITCDNDKSQATVWDTFKIDPKDQTDHTLPFDGTLYIDSVTACIKLMKFYDTEDANWTVTVDFEPLAAVENTVTVNGDAEAVKGLTVNIKKNGEVIATGITGDNGIAAITFVPGVYDIEITGFDTEKYGYNATKTTFIEEGGNFTVKFAGSGSYKFTVKKPDGTAAIGANITLKEGDTVIAEGTTDEAGVFTTDEVVLSTYSIIVTVSGNYYLKPVQTTADETDIELTLSAPASITHASDTSVPVLQEGKTNIKNASPRSGRYNYQFTAETAGTYTITMSSTVALYGVENVYLGLDGSTVSNAILANGTVTDPDNLLVLDEADINANQNKTCYTSVTIKLEAGQIIAMSLYINASNGLATVDITKN